MAKRVISKFNSNSERILAILNKQRRPQDAGASDFIFDSMDRKDRLMLEGLSGDSNASKEACRPNELYQRPVTEATQPQIEVEVESEAILTFRSNWNLIKTKLAA